MGRLGLGFPAARRRGPGGPTPPPPAPLSIAPAAGWTGVAGSGFASVPTDPVRTSAKPAMRPIVVHRQAFTDEILVGVYAGANNRGSMMGNMGLEKVRVRYEGNVIDIAQPGFETVVDANGQSRSYFGWWARLQHDGRNGVAHVYYEAIPSDATMQSRVIGPFRMLPSASMYDYDLEVAPSQPEIAGQRYQSERAAFNYLRAQSAQHPRIRIAEPGTYSIDGPVYKYTNGQGLCRIEASVPITIAKSEQSKDELRLYYDGLWFNGANITIDMRYIARFRLEPTDQGYWFDGVSIIHSGGRDEMWSSGQRPVPHIASENSHYTECDISGFHNQGGRVALARGCSYALGGADCFSNALCVVDCNFADWDSSNWSNEVPALAVQYTGAGGSATLELTNANEANGRTFTARVDGASVGTFTVKNDTGSAAAGTNYTVQNVADWLNGLAGWTASVLDDTRRATALGLPGTKGTASRPPMPDPRR